MPQLIVDLLAEGGVCAEAAEMLVEKESKRHSFNLPGSCRLSASLSACWEVVGGGTEEGVRS